MKNAFLSCLILAVHDVTFFIQIKDNFLELFFLDIFIYVFIIIFIFSVKLILGMCSDPLFQDELLFFPPTLHLQ